MSCNFPFRSFCALIVLIVITSPKVVAAVTLDWVTVGDPGNAPDTVIMARDGTTGYGRVDYTYQIGKYEITNAQYVEFLNAVAASDFNGIYDSTLFDPEMESSPFGGILRNGISGSYTYSVKPGQFSLPVSFVSREDAYRFANWLNNGQPVGPQSNLTTEDGAYDMRLVPNPPRKAGARIFVPNDNEWYKAAYYKAGSTNAGYWSYPIQSNFPPTADDPPGYSTSANMFSYLNPTRGPVDIGSYPLSSSAYGTFDQAGNIWELTEADAYWGAAFNSPTIDAASNFRYIGQVRLNSGFRLAAIPEPSLQGILWMGLTLLTVRRNQRAI